MSQKKAIIGVVIAAVVIAIVIIVVQQVSNSGNTDSVYAKKFTADYPNVQKLVAGIPQSGQTLGTATAPVTITEYMDYKCPICGAASSNLVPGLITTYVRTGKAKMILNPVHIIQGNQSVTAALAGLGIAPQAKMWQFTELILRNQGSEVDPWLTDRRADRRRHHRGRQHRPVECGPCDQRRRGRVHQHRQPVRGRYVGGRGSGGDPHLRDQGRQGHPGRPG